MPGITIYYSENSKKEKYHRWGDDSNIEPLVIKRSYDELEVDDIEIVEEFRLLFNLYYDSKSKEYKDLATDTLVVKIYDNNLVKIHMRFTQFMSFHILKFTTLAFCTQASGFKTGSRLVRRIYR